MVDIHVILPTVALIDSEHHSAKRKLSSGDRNEIIYVPKRPVCGNVYSSGFTRFLRRWKCEVRNIQGTFSEL